ncbi:MAG: hypothetical protein J6C28_05665 [Bacilli bacterium]|nr:hypothetical protein [Bacilli bacterium]
MQIQKGLVKYKDRNDILCTYGLTEEGRQYYFLDNTSMSNGNIIASTVLVEAIDPVVVASSIGVIDANGTVVIPFENKSIKPIMDGLLLVEVANSTTPSVVEANSMRSDPLAATKLVTTPAGIKEKINAKMGPEGRFIFNDQFSEATVCDYSGNNILDNQYFSFIAIKNNETLYLSKNTADSPVLEYSITNRMFVAQAEEAPLDVQNTEVTQETIDGAMQAEEKVVGFNAADITEKDFESVMDGASVEEPLPVEPSVVDASTAEVHTSTEAVTPTEEVEEDEEDDDSEEPISVIPDSINQEETVQEEVVEVDDPLQLDQSLVDNPVEENTELPVENTDEVVTGEAVTEAPVAEGAVNDAVVPEETPVDVPTDLDSDMAFEGTVVPEEEFVSEEVTADVPVEGAVPETAVEETVPEEVVADEVPVEEEIPTADVETEVTEEAPVDEVSEAMDEAFANALSEESEVVSEDIVEDTVETTDDKLMEFDFNEEVGSTEDVYTDVEEDLPVEDVVSDFKNDLFDVDLESDIFADSTVHADKIDVDDSYNDFSYKVGGAKDSIIEDVASTMTNLIRQNKSQKQVIASYEDKLDQAAAAYKKVVDKARGQLRDAEVLKNKLKNYETIVTKLEAKLEVLENKVRDQDKVIASQSRELESLRPQVEGKEELVRILADAQTLLDQ